MHSNLKTAIRLGCLFLVAVLSGAALAHKGSDAFVVATVEGNQARGYWDIHLRDVAAVVDIDTDRDQAITWGELFDRRELLVDYLAPRIAFANAGRVCRVSLHDTQISEHSDGVYAHLPFTVECETVITVLTLRYGFLFDIDAQHRAMVSITSNKGTQSRVLTIDAPEVSVDFSGNGTWSMISDYFREGVWHIWTGFDHVLFVVALLLAIVSPAGAGALRSRRTVVFGAMRLITAFTLAHSITLVLTALDVISLPSRLVESVIAISVAVAALNNIWNVLGRHITKITFAFGLIHGMGFAGALNDLGLPTEGRVYALASFNIGVEAGQLVIVGVLLPLMYAMRERTFYARRAVPVASFAIAVVAGVWFVQRAMQA